jgi:hypothetical protein
MKTAKLTKPIQINPALLPNEELRQLVFQIILRDNVESFARRMVVLLDDLKEGKTEALARIARQSADPLSSSSCHPSRTPSAKANSSPRTSPSSSRLVTPIKRLAITSGM